MALAVGDLAPPLALPDQLGTVHDLGVRRGSTSVALVFFPFAFTGVCEGELSEIRDDLGAFQQEGLEVWAVSCDSMYSLRTWSDAQGFFFPILSDFWPHGAVARAYDVLLDELGCPARGTFLVGTDGRLRFAHVGDAAVRRDLSGLRAAIAALEPRGQQAR